MRWLARDEEALPASLCWLTPAEAARAARLRHPKRRTEYLLRRLTGKHAVAAVLGLPTDPAGLARIEVANAPSGAPYAMVDGVPAGVEMSLTDRAGRAVCVVDTGPVGCDLEVVEPRSPAFLNDFLTGPERAYVTGRPDADSRDAAANLVWSAKESALKVLRTGLGRDTRSVVVTVQDGPRGAWAPLTVRAEEGTVFHGWWRRDGRFLFTVAAPQPGPPPAALEPAAGWGSPGQGVPVS
ncbi:MAG TPA: 4'-phosphopantetheinyl transferase superfamily protein [Micromonosporaceae bacterium]|nr:4'-phosphopantetheinyl transferase superfamily protein [Micromonosporaceae bacterium]